MASNKSKPLYKCTADERHKFTYHHAMKNGWNCTMCGADLKAKQNKIAEVEKLAKSLGIRTHKPFALNKFNSEDW